MNPATANNRRASPEQSLSRQRVQSRSHAHPRPDQPKPNPRMINVIGGLAAIFLTASPLHAGEISAKAGESIRLGRFDGVVYYTGEKDGYRVVATIAEGDNGSPVRFSTTLAEGQSARISLPGKLGEPGQSLEISRLGEKLIVTEVEAMSN
jgi:hypothetical protein